MVFDDKSDSDVGICCANIILVYVQSGLVYTPAALIKKSFKTNRKFEQNGQKKSMPVLLMVQYISNY